MFSLSQQQWIALSQQCLSVIIKTRILPPRVHGSSYGAAKSIQNVNHCRLRWFQWLAHRLSPNFPRPPFYLSWKHNQHNKSISISATWFIKSRGQDPEWAVCPLTVLVGTNKTWVTVGFFGFFVVVFFFKWLWLLLCGYHVSLLGGWNCWRTLERHVHSD